MLGTYELSVIIVAVLMVVSAFDYARRAWIRETDPVPATWVLMMTMMGLSFWMYWHSSRMSWTSNIGVTAGIVNVAIILTAVLATNAYHGTLRVAFDKTQKRCLLGGLAVLFFWAVTDQPLVSYILVQCIALIAYYATIKRLRKAERTTEPLFLWVSAFLGGLCALYPAWVNNDLFSWIYLGRGIPSTAYIIYLIVEIRGKMQKPGIILA